MYETLVTYLCWLFISFIRSDCAHSCRSCYRWYSRAFLEYCISYRSTFCLSFFIINIPFYLFSISRMGLSFTVTTILSVTILTLMTSMNAFLPDFSIPYWLGALGGGIVIGMGLSLLFRHQASLGGSNILALFLQKRFGFDPGKTNFLFDCVVVASSLYAIGWIKGFFSVLSIAVTSKVISYYKQGYMTKKSEQPVQGTIHLSPSKPKKLSTDL